MFRAVGLLVAAWGCRGNLSMLGSEPDSVSYFVVCFIFHVYVVYAVMNDSPPSCLFFEHMKTVFHKVD